MTIRAGDEPALPAVIAFAQRVLERWRGGLAVALFVGGMLAVRFTFLARETYESQAIVTARAALANTSPEALRDQLERALPELARERSRGDAASIFVASRGPRALLACRGNLAHVAHQRCSQLLTQALRKIPAVSIEQPASLPARPLAHSPASRAIIYGASLFLGLFSGLLWMVALSALVQPRARRGSRVTPHPTSDRPLAAPSIGSVRVTLLGAPEPAQPSANRKSLLPNRGRDPRELVSVDVASDWTLPPLGSREDELASLAAPLYLAAAERCLVLGIAGDEALREVKPRIAARVAVELARSEQARVLLVELDFDLPSIDRVLGLDMPPRMGFSQQLHAQLTSRAGQANGVWTVVRCTPHLSVLAEGRVRTPGMLHAHVLNTAIATLRSHFDLIVVNGPLAEIDSERRVLGDLADAIVYLANERGEQATARAAQHFARPQLFAVLSSR